jgi:putative ABC transport system permease protein
LKFLHEIKESVIISLNSLKDNKVRSFLAALGIVIGIVTVTILQTAIEGINIAFQKSIAAFGSDVLYIQKFEWFGKDDWEVYRNRRDITWQDYKSFAENMKNAESICPAVMTDGLVTYQNFTSENIPVFGTTEEYQKTLGLDVDEGRFFTKRESDGGRGVCVIGYDIKESFFRGIYPIGKTIQVSGHNFKIIGTYEKMGSMLGLFSLDNRIIIPISKLFKIFGSRRSLTINVKALSVDALEDTKEEVRSVMKRARRIPIGGKDDFGINQQETFKQTYESITGLIKITGTAITFLSLIVGSIGIANIMFVSVKERTKEIGIRKAIGAKRVTIMLQFLVESVTICVAGGIVGLVIAFPLSLIINALILPTVMPLWVALLALGISAFAGIAAGFFPAISASKLDPVDALRYE